MSTMLERCSRLSLRSASGVEELRVTLSITLPEPEFSLFFALLPLIRVRLILERDFLRLKSRLF